MSDLNDLFKQLAEAKANDPAYQKKKKIEDSVKESVKSDLGSLFSQLSEVKSEDPNYQRAKRLEKHVKESVKTDINSLFSELATLKKKQSDLIEEHPQLSEEVVEEVTEFEPELVEEVITEIAPLPTPVGVQPPEAQIPGLDKYLKAPSKKEEQEPSPYLREFKTVNDKIKFLEQWIGKIQNAGPGSGEVNLRNLDDVDRSTIVDGWYLKYNATTKKFDFGSPSAGGINPTDIKAVYAQVKNADTSTIHKGDPVYLYRATGNMASVIQAKNTSDQYSAKTLGLAYADFAPGQTGIIVTKGTLVGVDTSMYAEGDTLYLGATAGTLTNVKPSSPNHLVYIGVVERANQGQGIIYVSPQNGYELDEIHNVNINHLIALQDGHFLKWSAADNQWVNAPLPEKTLILSQTGSPSPDAPFRASVSTSTDSGAVAVYITAVTGIPGFATAKNWEFTYDGKMRFPDDTLQTTAWTGTYSYNDLTNKPTIPSLIGYATETYVTTAITNLVGAAPAALDTLKEIADQLATDESAVSSLTTTVAGKVSLTGSYANPSWITSLDYSKLTNTPTIPSLTGYATQSWVQSQGYLTSTDRITANGKSAYIDSVGQFILPQITQAGITAGYLTSAGNFAINANGNIWNLGADGTLTSPYNVKITTTGFQFPDSTTQTTAWTGKQATVSYTPATTTGAAHEISAKNTQGGTGWADFFKLTNISTGASNATKWVRMGLTGTLEVLNNAYSSVLLSLSDAGDLNVKNSISVNGNISVNGPTFSVYQNTPQSIPTDVQTKLNWNVEEYDTNGNFASNRFTPTVAGYYTFTAAVRFDSGIGTGERMIVIYKNGSEYKRGYNTKGSAAVGDSWMQMEITCQAYANGTGDYFEVYAQHGAGANRNTTGGAAFTYFQGCMLRGA